MLGEGERREAGETPGKDPFEEFAEDLERYERARGHGYRAQAKSEAGPSEAKDEIEADEFEDFAKKLGEKYNEKEGQADSSQVGQGITGTDNRVVSQEDPISGGLTDQAPSNRKHESGNSDAHDVPDLTNEALTQSVDSGRCQRNGTIVPEDLGEQPTRDKPERQTDLPDDVGPKGHPKPFEPREPLLTTPNQSISAAGMWTKQSKLGKESALPDEPSRQARSEGSEPVLLECNAKTSRLRESSDKTNMPRESPAESQGVLFTAHEWKVGESNYLRIPRRYLTAFQKDDTLEARVVRDSEPEKVQRLYTSAGFVEPHLNIYHLQPSRRETFHVLTLEKYEFTNFTRDFNKYRPKAFRNVKLLCSESKVMMKVDGNVVELKRPKLTSDGGGVVFQGALLEREKGGRIRITKRFEKFDLHLHDFPTSQPRILYMKESGSRIEIGHRLSQYEPDHRTRLIPAIPLEPHNDRREARLAKNRLLRLDRSSMTKKEIRAWIDTEGCLYVPRPGASSSSRLECTQKHREPLEAYVRGVEELTGVVAKIHQDKRGIYVAQIDDIEGIAKVISAVGPFRAPQRVDQVRRFMKTLTAEREGPGRRRVVERARKLLGL